MKVNFDTENNEVEINEATYMQLISIKRGEDIEDSQMLAWEISNILKEKYKVNQRNIFYNEIYSVVNISYSYKRNNTDKMESSFYFNHESNYFNSYETDISIKDIELHNKQDQESIAEFQNKLINICLDSDIKQRLKKICHIIKGI